MVWGLCVALIAGIEQRAFLCILLQIPFIILILRHRRSLRAACLYSCAALIFCLYGWVDSSSHQRDARAFAAAAAAGPLQLRGWISSRPVLRRGGSLFSTRARVMGREIDIGVFAPRFDLAFGDSIILKAASGALAPVGTENDPGRIRRMRSRGEAGFLQARAYETIPVPGMNGSFVVGRVFHPLHRMIRNDLVRRMGDRSGIALALLLGDRSMMHDRDSRAITDLGISHLFALSGLHLGLLMGILLLLTRNIRRGGTLLLCLLPGIYVGTVGKLVSLRRAYAMVVIGCAARTLQRPLQPLSILSRALLVLLLIDPGSFYSAGFQLSFMATFAVLIAVARLRIAHEPGFVRRSIASLRASLMVSFYAQLFILPLALTYFGSCSLLTPLTTIFFMPPVFLVLLLSGVCCTAALLSPGLGTLLYGALARGTEFFSVILQGTASIAPAPLRIAPPSLFLYYAGLALIFSPGCGRVRMIAGLLLAGASFFCGGIVFLP